MFDEKDRNDKTTETVADDLWTFVTMVVISFDFVGGMVWLGLCDHN